MRRIFVLLLLAQTAIAWRPANAPATTVTLTGGVYAKMDTTEGNLVIQLQEKDAPKTVKNFIDLAEGKKPWQDPKTGQLREKKPLYDGTTFHRVIKGFMAQGGDPAGTGKGDVGFTIALEKSPNLKHDKPGVVAMARRGQPDTASCQFYITFKPCPFLDTPPGYTVFGQVLYGMETVYAIEKCGATEADMQSGRGDAPTKKITINKVTIIRVAEGQKKDILLKTGATEAAKIDVPAPPAAGEAAFASPQDMQNALRASGMIVPPQASQPTGDAAPQVPGLMPAPVETQYAK